MSGVRGVLVIVCGGAVQRRAAHLEHYPSDGRGRVAFMQGNLLTAPLDSVSGVWISVLHCGFDYSVAYCTLDRRSQKKMVLAIIDASVNERLL